MCLREESNSASLRENSPSYVNNLEKEGVGVGKKTRKTRDRSRINETISKKRGDGEARDKNKGAQKKRKERRKTQLGGGKRKRQAKLGGEAGNQSQEEARMSPQVRSWENRNARLRSSKATAPTTRGLAAS